MIKTIVILLSLCWGFESRAQTDSTILRTNPEFPGGWSAFRALMKEQMQYPERARELGIDGKCHIQFIVDTDGSINDVKILRGVPDCLECDKETIRFVKSMPPWIPATEKGKPVRSTLQLPFYFIVH